MGGDGGSIPKRDDLVRNKKKQEKLDRDLEILGKWLYCALSHLPLQKPIVSCELGRLYSKDAVIEFLLDRTKCDARASFEHIRGLKDIKTLQLTENPTFSGTNNEKGDGYNDHHAAPYICPVTGLEMNGRYKFCYLYQCGCVFAERSFKEVETNVCHKCGTSFERQDIIVLNPDEEDAKRMQEAMEQRREKAKLSKKSKTKTTESAVVKDETSISNESSQSKPKSIKANASVSSATVKKENITVQQSKLSQPTKRVSSVQDDPNASKVFKSLFTSSSDAKKVSKTHFVS